MTSLLLLVIVYTDGTMDRMANLLISSNVQYAHLGGDNKSVLCVCCARFCHDYDLCSACEQRGGEVHDPSHMLLKMSLPLNQVKLSTDCIDSVLRRSNTGHDPRSVTTTTAAALAPSFVRSDLQTSLFLKFYSL